MRPPDRRGYRISASLSPAIGLRVGCAAILGNLAWALITAAELRVGGARRPGEASAPGGIALARRHRLLMLVRTRLILRRRDAGRGSQRGCDEQYRTPSHRHFLRLRP